MKNLLGIWAVISEELPDDIQHTKERKPDVLKKIKDVNGNSFILQIEFQVADETEMIYRMAEYYIMLLRVYRLPVKQYVVFLGKAKPKMQTQLTTDNLQFNFEVLSLRNLNYEVLINSNQPEEIVFGILADFGAEASEKVVTKIIQRLDETSKSPLSFQKYIRQLRVLSKLRKLDLRIEETMESIAKYIDEENDYLYIKGEQKAKERFVANLLTKTKHTLDQVANIAEVSVDFVKMVKKSLVING